MTSESVAADIYEAEQLQGQAQSLVTSLTAQLADARNVEGDLGRRLTNLRELQTALAATDAFTLAAYAWVQDPVTLAWTGTPVKYPGVVSNQIAVYGGTGDVPVVQTAPLLSVSPPGPVPLTP